MKSTLRIITQQTKTLKNFKLKTFEKPNLKISKHMKKFSNFKFDKTTIIHYEKKIKNNASLEGILGGNTNLPIYKYRKDPKIEKVRY